MQSSKNVVIVSVYGRGNWLATELASQGLSVALVDVTEQMGRWAPEDWEGPFGFFRSERLAPSQLQRLVEDGPEEAVPQGFTLWLDRGPIEMKGPLSSFALEKSGASPAATQYLLRYEGGGRDLRDGNRRKLMDQSFSQTWLVQMAHQLASNRYRINSESLEEGRPLSLFSPYFFRQVSRQGHQRGLDLCRSRGVTVLADGQTLDISVQRKRVEGVEVASESESGFLACDQFVWMLSSEETKRMAEPLSTTLFPHGAIAPDWLWMRLRLSIEKGLQFDAMPSKLVVVDDVRLPWAHANICMVEKTSKEGDVDAWVRVPAKQRFHRAYIDVLSQDLVKLFSLRLAGLGVTVSQMPQDYLYDYAEMGAPCFPVFTEASLGSLRRATLHNCSFDGPENWDGLDWQSQFDALSEIRDQIGHKMKRMKEARSPQKDVEL